MSMFRCSEKMPTKQQNQSINYHTVMKSSDPSSAIQKNRLQFPAETVMDCLFGRYRPVFVDAKNLGNSRGEGKGVGGALNMQTWKKSSHGLSYSLKEDSHVHQSHALRSLPPELCLCVSSIPGAKFGVCTRKPIPAGTWIGPFEGKSVRPDELGPDTDTSQMWEIFEDNKLSYFLDGRKASHSSWMRFIQCARSKDEQNLCSLQYRDDVYYRSFKDIAIGEELLVWYDEKYLQHFGIPTGLPDLSLINSGDGATGSMRAPLVLEQRLSPPLQRQQQWKQQQQREKEYQKQGKTPIPAERRSSPPLQQQQQQQKQLPQDQQQPTLQLPLQSRAALFSRSLSTESNHTDPRSSPLSEAESDVSDGGNNQKPIAKGPVSELASWQCQQCHKTFTQRVALQMHACPCQPNKPFHCGQCSVSFSSSSQLRAHVVSHSSKKPFKCGFCSRAFAGATTLNNHIRSHMGRKPFGCEKCGKTFSQAGLLARHARNPRECKASVRFSPIKA